MNAGGGWRFVERTASEPIIVSHDDDDDNDNDVYGHSLNDVDIFDCRNDDNDNDDNDNNASDDDDDDDDVIITSATDAIAVRSDEAYARRIMEEERRALQQVGIVDARYGD
jgi:hypothetical protein